MFSQSVLLSDQYRFVRFAGSSTFTDWSSWIQQFGLLSSWRYSGASGTPEMALSLGMKGTHDDLIIWEGRFVKSSMVPGLHQ